MERTTGMRCFVEKGELTSVRIPVNIYKTMKLNEYDMVEIFIDGDKIILKKWN